MALPNNDPIYSRVGLLQSSSLLSNTVAATVYDGSGTIGTDVFIVWTADATNGGFIQRVRIKYVANGTTTSNACVIKLFYTSSASGAVTNANCWFLDEIAIPATGTLTTTAGNVTYDVPLNFALNPGYSIVAKHTVAQSASTGFICTGIGGKY